MLEELLREEELEREEELLEEILYEEEEEILQERKEIFLKTAQKTEQCRTFGDAEEQEKQRLEFSSDFLWFLGMNFALFFVMVVVSGFLM